MTLQMERGTQNPLRPATMALNMASGFAVPLDPAPVDWEVAGTRLTPTVDSEVMDDSGKVTLSATNVQLQRGIYQVDLTIHVLNASAGADDILVAVTNFAGTTVHFASDAITVPAVNGGDFCYSATVVVTIAPNTTGAQDGIVIRAAASAASALTIQPASIGKVTKIGNYGEGGPA